MTRIQTEALRTDPSTDVGSGGVVRSLLQHLEPVSLTELDTERVANVPHPELASEIAGPSVDWPRIAEEYGYAAFKEFALNFSAGAWGIVPLPVIRAQTGAMLNPSAFVDPPALRRKAAETFGGTADTFVLASNTTTNLSKLIPALNLGKGDVVLRSNGMHRAVTDPLEAAKSRGARIEIIDLFQPDLLAGATKEKIVDAFRQAMDAEPKARVLFLNHVMPDSGLVLPLEEICALAKDRGITTVVDGALAPGQLDVDLSRYGCDVYAASLGKWMGGPAETGFLWVAPETLAKLGGKEFRAGKDVTHSIERFLPQGAPSNDKLAGLEAAIDRIAGLGPKQVAQRIQSLAQYLVRGLEGIDGVSVASPKDREVSAGIVGFEVAGWSWQDLGDALAKSGIKVHPRAPFVRVDCQLNVTEADADRLIEVLRGLAEKR
jgi:isopenicillin-N epimerase